MGGISRLNQRRPVLELRFFALSSHREHHMRGLDVGDAAIARSAEILTCEANLRPFQQYPCYLPSLLMSPAVTRPL
jgi:hypothetical protein